MRIQLCAYTIVSCFCVGNGCEPKKWEIQGSNDLSKWTLLHSIDNDDSLLGKYSSSTFYVDDVSESYRYIKYIQKENHSTNKIIHLSGFELFGTLSGNIPT